MLADLWVADCMRSVAVLLRFVAAEQGRAPLTEVDHPE